MPFNLSALQIAQQSEVSTLESVYPFVAATYDMFMRNYCSDLEWEQLREVGDDS